MSTSASCGFSTLSPGIRKKERINARIPAITPQTFKAGTPQTPAAEAITNAIPPMHSNKITNNIVIPFFF